MSRYFLTIAGAFVLCTDYPSAVAFDSTSSVEAVRSVVVRPDTQRLEPGDTGWVVCEPRNTPDTSGSILANRCKWRSQDTAAAKLLVSGQTARVVALDTGFITVTAAVKNLADSTLVAVVPLIAASAPGPELYFDTTVSVLPSEVSLNGSTARATLQGYCRDRVLGTLTSTWSWAVANTGVVASIASTKSAVTLVPAGNGTTTVIGTCAAASKADTASVVVSNFPVTGGCNPTATHICPGDNLIAKVNAQPSGTAFTLGAGVHYVTAKIPVKQGQSFTGPTFSNGLDYPTEATGAAVIDGGKVLTGWTSLSGRWYVDGQTQEGTVATTTGSCQAAFPRCLYPEMLWRDGWAQSQTADLASCNTADEWFFDYAANRIYVCGDPTGDVIETNVAQQAFASTVTGVTIKRLEIRHFAASGQGQGVIQPMGTGWRMDSLYVHRSYGTGIRFEANGTAYQGRYSNLGQYGLNGGNNNIRFVINGVRCDSNATAGWTRGFGTGCSKFFGTNGVAIDSSLADLNFGNGWWFDINNQNDTVRYTTARDNWGTGFFYEISYGPFLMEHDTSTGNGTVPTDAFQNGAAVLCSASANCEVRFSVFTNNEHGPMTLQQSRGTGTLGAHIVENAYFHDNTITQAGGTGGYKGAFEPVQHHTGRNNRWLCNDWIVSGGFQFVFENANKTDAQWTGAGHDVPACGSIARSP
jgi:hypothetical protein